MTPKIARVDANQKEIVDALREIGATVAHTHAVGRDFPDIIVGFRGLNYLMEIKDGNKIPSKKKLTPGQEEWHKAWRGQVAKVESINEALALIGAIEIDLFDYLVKCFEEGAKKGYSWQKIMGDADREMVVNRWRIKRKLTLSEFQQLRQYPVPLEALVGLVEPVQDALKQEKTSRN